MKEFIKKMLSAKEGVSSKRFNGTIGFLNIQLIVLFLTVYDTLKDGILSPLVGEIITYDLIVSASLLGVAAIEKFWSTKNTAIK